MRSEWFYAAAVATLFAWLVCQLAACLADARW